MIACNASDDRLLTLADQTLHARLFRHLPTVLTLSQQEGRDIFEPFLVYAAENNLSMNWALPIHLLNWLRQHERWSSHVGADMMKELLTASVIRWSLMGLDHVTAKGMMVISKHLPQCAVGIWKNEAVDRSNKIVVMQLPISNQAQEDSYAISYEHGSWKNIKWMALPL